MTTSSIRNTLLAASFLAVSPAFAADVHTVAPTPGAADFTTIQAAVDAALDGDTVLVRSATSYAAFTLDGKGLSIVADSAAAIAQAVPQA